MAIILDIETCPIDGVEFLMEPAKAPSNYSDPAKIAAYVEKAQAEQVSKASLFPWTARIVALGLILTDGTEVVTTCRTEADEAIAITALAKTVYRDDDRFVHPIVGFNHRQFDLPVILARAMLLGVDFPALNLDRYRTPHVDLMDKLTWYGTVPPRSLKWYAKRFGLPLEDAISGADIAGLVAADRWTDVAAHCLSDVRLTRALAERMGVVRGMKAVA